MRILDLLRSRDLGDRFGDLALLILGEDLVAERDALVADVDGRARDELPDRVLRLAAERAAKMFIVRHSGDSARGAHPVRAGTGGIRELTLAPNRVKQR